MKQHTLMSKKFRTMLLSGTLTMMVVSILLMSDQLIAGFLIGSKAVAGITLVTPIISLSAFFGSVISLGVPILYSTEMGKFNKEKADKVFGLGLFMSIVVGVAMFLTISLFGEAYLKSSSPSDEILEQAIGYLKWMRFTVLIMPIQMFMAASVYHDGDETISMIADVVQGLGNIIFSIVLCRLIGIPGIGLSSFLFNALSLIVLMTHFLKKSNSMRLNLCFSFGLLKDAVRYSIIDSSSYLFLAIFTSVMNFYMTSHFGAEYLVIVSALTLSREFQMLFDGIGGAVSPIFSVYVGENNREGIRLIYSLAQKTAIIEGIIVTIALMLFAPFVPHVLNVTDPVIAQWMITCLRITTLGNVFVSLLYLLTSYYLIVERIILGTVACAMRDVAFSVLLVFVFGGIAGMYGMFFGLAAAPALAYGALLLYITLRYGRKDCPLLLSTLPGSEDTYLFNLVTEPEDIIRTQRKAEEILMERGLDSKTFIRAALLIEEMYMFIRKMNDNKAVLAECSVTIKPDGVLIISKDEGVYFDMADEKMSTASLSAYTVSLYLQNDHFRNRHLTAMGFNRSACFVKSGEEKHLPSGDE